MNLKKISFRSLLAGAAIGLATVANPVQADLFAFAKQQIDNFVILGSDGQPLDVDVDFNSLVFTSSADMGGVLTGTPGFDFNEPNGDDIQFTSSCLSTTGNCVPNPLPEDTFPLITNPPLGVDYVAADQNQFGSPILNLDPFTQQGDADVAAIAVGTLSATAAKGSANVNNGLEANWTFSLAQAQGITFEGDVETYVEAFASGDELEPGKASANTSFVITITDTSTGIIVFDSNNIAAFDLLNETTSASANDAINADIRTCGNFAALFMGCGTELATSFSETTVALAADTLYQLSIRGNANIDIARVVEVPEPGILAMLGLGLLGLSLRRRRA